MICQRCYEEVEFVIPVARQVDPERVANEYYCFSCIQNLDNINDTVVTDGRSK